MFDGLYPVPGFQVCGSAVYCCRRTLILRNGQGSTTLTPKVLKHLIGRAIIWPSLWGGLLSPSLSFAHSAFTSSPSFTLSRFFNRTCNFPISLVLLTPSIGLFALLSSFLSPPPPPPHLTQQSPVSHLPY